MRSMTQKEALKSELGQTRSIEVFLSKWGKKLFIVALIGYLLYVSIFIGISAEKFAAFMGVPILIEMIVLGLSSYFVTWIRSASSIRTMLASSFVIVMGLSVIVSSPGLLFVGAVISLFAVALLAYGVRKYMLTKDLGVKTQDPIITLSMVVFMTSLVAAVLGSLSFFAVSFACAVLIYFYASLVTDIALTFLVTLVFYTQIAGSMIHIWVSFSVGVASILTGLYLKRREAIASLAAQTSTLRFLIGGGYGLTIGSLLAIMNPTVLGIGVGVVAFVLGIVFVVYGVMRTRATRDLGIRRDDPVRTLSFVFLLTSILLLVVGEFGPFIILFAGFLSLMTYNRLYLSIFVTFLAAGGIYIVLGFLYSLPAIFVGAFAVVVGILIDMRRSQLVRHGTRKKK